MDDIRERLDRIEELLLLLVEALRSDEDEPGAPIVDLDGGVHAPSPPLRYP